MIPSGHLDELAVSNGTTVGCRKSVPAPHGRAGGQRAGTYLFDSRDTSTDISSGLSKPDAEKVFRIYLGF
jgi:hypothetical protein